MTPAAIKRCAQGPYCTCTDVMAERCEQNRLADIPWRRNPPRDWVSWFIAAHVVVIALVALWIGFSK